MSRKKITVIIPVYNAMTSGGGYINRCIDSVLGQKDFPMKDVEILVINDGSTDNSLEVLRKIEQQNSGTITVVDQKNQGVARTRNKGIKLAKGEYVVFIDQDDWIEENYFATFYSKAKSDNCDVVIGGYVRPNIDGKIVLRQEPANDQFYRYIVAAAWAKIHRTDFLRKNKIQFFNNSYGEDLPFTYHENITTDRYKIIDYSGYNWFLNTKSISETVQKRLSFENVRSIVRLLNRLREVDSGTPAEERRSFDYAILRTYVYYLLNTLRSSSYNEFIQAQKQLSVWMESNYKHLCDAKGIRHPKIPKCEKLTYRFIIQFYIFLDRAGLISVLARLFAYR